MSIASHIAALEASGKLTRIQPQTRHPLRRELFLTEDAVKTLNDRASAVCVLVGRAQIEDAMQRWVRGQLVYAHGRQGGFLKRLQSPPMEIWEMRVTEPVVQARLFARFARPDTLILTHLYTRKILGRKIVRRKPSQHWQKAMHDCEAAWNKLLPETPPFSKPSVHDYITENCDDFELLP